MSIVIRLRSTDREQYEQMRALFSKTEPYKIPVLIVKGELESHFCSILIKHKHKPKTFGPNVGRAGYQQSWMDTHDIFVFTHTNFASSFKNIQFPISNFCIFGYVTTDPPLPPSKQPDYVKYWNTFQSKMPGNKILKFQTSSILYSDILNDMDKAQQLLNISNTFQCNQFHKVSKWNNNHIQNGYNFAEKQAMDLISNELFIGDKLIDSLVINHRSQLIQELSIKTAFNQKCDLNLNVNKISNRFITNLLNVGFAINLDETLTLLNKIFVNGVIFDFVINNTNFFQIMGQFTNKFVNRLDIKTDVIQKLILMISKGINHNKWMIKKDKYLMDTLNTFILVPTPWNKWNKYAEIANLSKNICLFPGMNYNELRQITKLLNILFLCRSDEVIDHVLFAYNSLYKIYRNTYKSFDSFSAYHNDKDHKEAIKEKNKKEQDIVIGHTRSISLPFNVPLVIHKLIHEKLSYYFNTNKIKFNGFKKLINLMTTKHMIPSIHLIANIIKHEYHSIDLFYLIQDTKTAKLEELIKNGLRSKLKVFFKSDNTEKQDASIIYLLYNLSSNINQLFVNINDHQLLLSYLNCQKSKISNGFQQRQIQQIQNILQESK